MNILKLSWKNILSKPLNSLMSILLFALSIGMITFLMLFNHQFKLGLDNNLAGIDLVIGAKGSPLQLILNSMYHIDNPTGNIPLEEAKPFLNPKHPLIKKSYPLALGDSYGAYRIVGAPPSLLTLYNAENIEGNIYKKDFEAVVGKIAADQLHLHIGDHFYSTHGLADNPDFIHDHGSPFVITGILEKTGSVLDQLILCNPQTIWKVHEHDTATAHEMDHQHAADTDHVHIAGPVSQIDTNEVLMLTDSVMNDLKANDEKEITSILVEYRQRNIQTLNLPRNINQNTGLMAASPSYEINRLYAMIGSGAEAIRYLAILIAFVAAVSIFISLYSSLKDRRYEMALMRISGAGPGKIFSMITAEGLWISFLGLIVGLLLGHAGMTLAGNVLEKSYRYQFTGWIWIPEELYTIIGAFIIGILASVIPAIEGSKTDIHKTLAEN